MAKRSRTSNRGSARRSGFSPTNVGLKADLRTGVNVGLKADLQADLQADLRADLHPRERVWQVVATIPEGQVMTYGQVAALSGIPRGARFVGSVLRNLPPGSRLPWHRVLNAAGRISVDPITAREQRERLEIEGVAFLAGRIDLSRFGWGR